MTDPLASDHPLELLRRAVQDLKGEDPLAPVTILVPSNIAGITARRYLARHGGVAAIDVTTISRYAEKIGAPLVGSRRPATRAVVSAAWRAELDRHPGAFADVAAHPATIAALTRTFRDLRELNDGQLDLVATQPMPAPDLVRLHRAVRASLQDWYDEIDVLDAAATATLPNEPTVLYLIGRLTPSEQRFINALAGQRIVTISDSRHDLTATGVMHASDADEEVRVVVRRVMAALGEGRRVGVLYADPRPYSRLLAEQLHAAGIRFNGPGARPVSERAVVRSFLSLLELASTDLPRGELFRALSGAPTRNFDGERIPVAWWERMSRSAGVVRGDHWDERLLTWVMEEAPKNARDEGQRLHDFVRELRSRIASAPATWAELVTWAGALCDDLLVDDASMRQLPPEEQYGVTRLRTALRGLVVLDQTATPASPSAMHALLEADLERALSSVGRFGDGVYVGPLSSAAGLEFDQLHVVGLSEDLYPGSWRDNVLIPERIRHQLGGVLPQYRDEVERQRIALAAAFGTASTVVASFPRGDLRQTRPRLPSRWLLPTLRALANTPDLVATEWEGVDYGAELHAAGSFAGELFATDELATEQEWRTRAAAAQSLADEVMEQAEELLSARASEHFTRFDGNLAGLDGLPDYRTLERAISPTSLETYADCPHAYFVQKLLHVEPIENPEDIVTIPPHELGSYIHRCVEVLVKLGDLPGPGEAWSAEHHDRLQEIGRAEAAKLEGRGLTGHQRLWVVERDRVAVTLRQMLEEDSRWRSVKGAAVHAAELSFGLDDGPPPVRVPAGDGHIHMRGSVDKVDVADDRVYVTDIKTGRKDKFTSIKHANPAPHGSKLQLPVYALAASQHLDTELPVTAVYWFVHKDSGRVELVVDDTVVSHYGRVLGVLVDGIAGGIFPARPPKDDDFLFVQCAYCNPDGLGYAARRREWAAKKGDPAMTQLVALVSENLVPGTEATDA